MLLAQRGWQSSEVRIIIKPVQCDSNHLWRWIHLEPAPIHIHQTSLGVDATNPISHLVYTFECQSMRLAFASVDRPIHVVTCTCIAVVVCVGFDPIAVLLTCYQAHRVFLMLLVWKWGHLCSCGLHVIQQLCFAYFLGWNFDKNYLEYCFLATCIIPVHYFMSLY